MSPAMEASQKYVLGIDIGSASLGWALIALDGAEIPYRSSVLASVSSNPVLTERPWILSKAKISPRQLIDVLPGCTADSFVGVPPDNAICFACSSGIRYCLQHMLKSSLQRNDAI
ncbi:MAG TPA: hypothetical protein VGC07_11255 [Granulicella sp.]